MGASTLQILILNHLRLSAWTFVVSLKTKDKKGLSFPTRKPHSLLNLDILYTELQIPE